MNGYVRIFGCLVLLNGFTSFAGSQDVRLSVQLRDGTRIVGKPLESSIRVRTDYAEIQIPFTLLSNIVFAGGEQLIVVTMKGGDRISGHAESDKLQFESLLGTVSAPLKDIVRISILPDDRGESEGLAAHFPLNGNANDISGNGKNGMAHVLVPTVDRFEVQNNACYFSGNDSYIDLGTDSTLNPTQSITITAWISIAGGETRDIVSRWETRNHETEERTFAFGVRSDNNLYWIISPDGSHENSSVITSAEPVLPSTWTFVVALWDGSTMSLFKNGVRLGTTRARKMVRAADVRASIGAVIGRPGDPVKSCFHGAIDDVRIYSRPLDKEEIKSLYTQR